MKPKTRTYRKCKRDSNLAMSKASGALPLPEIEKPRPRLSHAPYRLNWGLRSRRKARFTWVQAQQNDNTFGGENNPSGHNDVQPHHSYEVGRRPLGSRAEAQPWRSPSEARYST